MALATQCPFCQTTFRVANDQLKLRDGLVRCGHCHEVFDGNAHLLADQQSAGNWPTLSSAALPSSAAPTIITPAIARANAAAPNYGEPPVAALPDAQAMAGIEAAWDLPPSSAEEEFSPPAGNDADADADAGINAGEESDSETIMIEEDTPTQDAWRGASETDHGNKDFDAALLPLQPSSEPHDTGLQEDYRHNHGRHDDRADHVAFDDSAAYSADSSDSAEEFGEVDTADEAVDEPEFILAAQRRERRARLRRVLMIVFSVILIFTGLLQAVYLERHRIALAAPKLKPLLVTVCRPLNCTVGLQRQIDQLSIESNELQAATPDHPALTLNLLVRNRADSALAWPYIELTLNDDDEKALIRRVFSPAEYLPAGQTVEAGMAADSEQPVKLSFTLGQTVASGYRVYLFYP
jgi:predicted Zn finger-like uncharacterized protein